MTARTVLPWLVTTGVFALSVGLTLRHGVDLPYVDEWRMIPLAVHAHDGDLSMEELWRGHNEHTSLFPRLAVAGLSQLTGWNLRTQMLATQGLMLASFVVLCLVLRRLPGSTPWLISALALVWFSAHGWMNWVWGIQVQLGLCLFGVVGAFALLGSVRLSRLRYGVAALLAVMSSWSFLAGFLCWPVGALLLLVRPCESGRRRAAWIGLWVALGAGALGVHRAHEGSPAADPAANVAQPQLSLSLEERPLANAPLQAGVVTEFVTRFLGTAIVGPDAAPTSSLAAGVMGVMALVVAILILGIAARRRPAAGTMAALAVFGVACGVMIAVGRVPQTGLAHATASRYTSLAAPAWLAVLTVIVALGRTAPPRLRRLALLASAITFIPLAITQVESHRSAAANGDQLRAARVAMSTGQGISWDVLTAAFGGDSPPWLPRLKGWLTDLRHRQLSLFREHGTEPPSAAPLTCTVTRKGKGKGPLVTLVVRCTGAIPGNATACLAMEGASARPAQATDAETDGSVTFTFIIPKEQATKLTGFQVVSIDGGGGLRWSPVAPTPR